MFQEIDLRDHAVSCADATTQAFDRLGVTDGFIFVADHDPIALRYLFEAERAGQFTWEPLAEDDNGVWRVQVTRVAAAVSLDGGESSAMPSPGPSRGTPRREL